MSKKIVTHCDICGTECGQDAQKYADPETGVWYAGTVSYRIYGPHGLKGEKLDLCARHAKAVHDWVYGKLREK